MEKFKMRLGIASKVILGMGIVSKTKAKVADLDGFDQLFEMGKKESAWIQPNLDTRNTTFEMMNVMGDFGTDV